MRNGPDWSRPPSRPRPPASRASEPPAAADRPSQPAPLRSARRQAVQRPFVPPWLLGSPIRENHLQTDWSGFILIQNQGSPLGHVASAGPEMGNLGNDLQKRDPYADLRSPGRSA